EKYTILTKNRTSLSLKEKDDGTCIFLDVNNCLIYPVRPVQCTTFPAKWRVSEVEKFCKGWK
ncbi:YkgJ family cysteine cluster protein, partial [Chlamydiota bacterium]